MSREVTIKHNFIKSMECRKITKRKVLVVFFFKKQQKFQINNLTHHLQELEKEKQTKPKETVKIIKSPSCLTLCNPTDCTVHGILQARILQWVGFPFSRGSSQPRDWIQVSHITHGFFTSWATREARSERNKQNRKKKKAIGKINRNVLSRALWDSRAGRPF